MFIQDNLHKGCLSESTEQDKSINFTTQEIYEEI